MSDLQTIIRSANVTRALVVDDAYEATPIAKDLSQDEEKWGQFFEDLAEADVTAITKVFPLYSELRADELRGSDAFVGTLWRERLVLRLDLIEPLFERYRSDKAQDLAYLETLTRSLEGCGVQCLSAGKDFHNQAIGVDLIVIDLFLGSAQDDEAIENSMNGLKEVIRRRQPNPPLVILMSRSSRLEEKRREFRDTSGLFESAFRIIRKTELAEEGKLPRVLRRLAEHYQESTRLAVFLHSWQTGLNSACERTANLIRTLDLADHAQIRQLLLADEEEPPGNYLVDVFDLVLQHEVEGEASIIDAAIQLNGLDSANYPPPYVSGSPDLQALVYRCLFRNNGRLRLAKPSGNLVVFGDILRRKHGRSSNIALEVGADGIPLPDIGPLDVLIVLTPACDLQRVSAKRIFLLKGSLIPLTRSNWSSEEVSARTAVFETPSHERFQIKWDLKHIEAISPNDLSSILTAPRGLEVVARLRESYALELQQKLLASLGRVGMIAAMPGTFSVGVQAYLPDKDRRLFKIDIPALTANQGVCFVGRKNDKLATTLVLCEDACEGVCEALQSIDLSMVHPTTAETIRELRNTGELLILQKGIDISRLSESSYVEIASGGLEQQKRSIGLIRKRGNWFGELLKNNQLKLAGVVLVITDDDVPSQGERSTENARPEVVESSPQDEA